MTPTLPTLTPTQRSEFARLLHDLIRGAAVLRAQRLERTDAVSLDAAEMAATGQVAVLADQLPEVVAISAVVSDAIVGEGE